MALKNMARSKKDRKKAEKEMAVGMSDEKFPFGLSLSLDDESLSKLGMDKLPNVGDKVAVTAVGAIESVSENKSVNSKNRNVRIQIERLDVKRGEFKSATDAVSAAVKDA